MRGAGRRRRTENDAGRPAVKRISEPDRMRIHLVRQQVPHLPGLAAVARGYDSELTACPGQAGEDKAVARIDEANARRPWGTLKVGGRRQQRPGLPSIDLLHPATWNGCGFPALHEVTHLRVDHLDVPRRVEAGPRLHRRAACQAHRLRYARVVVGDRHYSGDRALDRRDVLDCERAARPGLKRLAAAEVGRDRKVTWIL